MKKVFTLLFCAAALFGAISCSDDSSDVDVNVPDTDTDTDTDSDAQFTSYLYALNCGVKDNNNGSLTRFNIETEEVVDDLFTTVNGYGLGDVAQDMIVFDDKIFISVTNSNKIYVTDLKGEEITSIQGEAPYSSPRYFAVDDEYVYVSYYDGGVAKINPETYELTTAPATIYAEQIVVVDDKLYVTISLDFDTYATGKTIDVYDTATMTYEKSIDVITNPSIIKADDNGNLYVVSMGNYGFEPGAPAIYATLQKIDTAGNVTVIDVTDIEDATPTMISMGADDKLYVVEGVSNASTSWVMVGDIYVYDTVTGEIETFITDGTTIPSMFSISANKETGELYVGTSSYNVTGDVYVMNADGTFNTSFEVGYNVMKVLPFTIEE